MHTIAVSRDRPDFRVFIDLLYGADRNVDTDGNSYPVNSRTWTHLYIADRESNDPSVEIFAIQEQPLLFSVESSSQRLEELAALYLYMTCGTSIAKSSQSLSSDIISSLQDKYRTELQRAKNAVWHKSSNDSPYPQRA
jgi:hypothetical protein